MNIKIPSLAAIAILAGLYLGLIEIAAIIAVSILLIGYTGKKPSKKSKKTGKKTEETILHPVVYEDAGDPPKLYPEKSKIKVYPNGTDKKLSAQHMADTVENVTKITAKGAKKLLK
ncbi:MAG: hypothetical protein ACOCTT_02055 [archaeon]